MAATRRKLSRAFDTPNNQPTRMRPRGSTPFLVQFNNLIRQFLFWGRVNRQKRKGALNLTLDLRFSKKSSLPLSLCVHLNFQGIGSIKVPHSINTDQNKFPLKIRAVLFEELQMVSMLIGYSTSNIYPTDSACVSIGNSHLDFAQDQ